MELFILSFLAGILTVAAPCILPLLPVIVGGSIVRGGNDEDDQQKNWHRPLVIAVSLAVSVVIFSLLLKATTALLDVPQMFWQVISGIIVLLLGINLLLPILWEKLAVITGFHSSSNKFLSSSYSQKGITGDITLGLALGPVFNSCSPTYALIVATILPASFAKGFLYLSAYALGLAGALLVIAYLGQSVVAKLGWISDPAGLFRRIIGALFILVGLAVIFGIDKDIQTYVLDRGWYDPISGIEESLR